MRARPVRRHLLAAALCRALLAAPISRAEEAPLPASLASLVEAERAFARDGVAMGVRDSFLAHFAEDGIAFYPHPVNAREAMRLRPVAPRPPAVILDWEPETGQVSAAGDLGFDTGPARVEVRDGSRPPRFSTFFSVWRKQPDGFWAVVLDMGMSRPDPGPLRPRPFRPAFPDGPRSPSDPSAVSPEPLLLSERAVVRRVATAGWDAACPGLFAETGLALRDGAAPAAGRQAACALASPGPEATTWEALEADLSRSGDLGYAWGRYRKGSEEGYYTRVWHRRGDGSFEVVLDAATAVPEEPPAAAPVPLSSRELVTWVPAMPRVRVRKDLAFPAAGGAERRFDLYVPPGPVPEEPRPAVVLVNGAGDPGGAPARKEHGPFRSWARRFAAEGILAVTFESRAPDGTGDLAALLSHLRREGRALGLDAGRLLLFASGDDVEAALSVAASEAGAGLRGLVALHGEARSPEVRVEAPVLVVRAGADSWAPVERADALVEAARRAKAPWTVVNLPGLPRAFDVLDAGEASRRAVELTVDWTRRQLTDPPPRAPGR